MSWPRPPWEWVAPACRGAGARHFFGEGGDLRVARALCAGCPEREECREWGIRHEPFGVWGGAGAGTLEAERARRGLPNIVPGRRRYGPAECGTDSGYRRHFREGEPACEPCRRAHAADRSARRAKASA